MRITCMDIDNKEFKKIFRGYDIDEVDEFLSEISDNYEEVYKENSVLKEKLSMYEDKVNHYQKIEETIQNTLVLAQKAAEQAKQSSQKEADIIIKNANDSAQRILDKANNDVLKINDEYERIRQEFEKFRSLYRSFMNGQMEMFERLEKDFQYGYNIGRNIKDGLKDIEPESIKTSITPKKIEKNNKNVEVKEKTKHSKGNTSTTNIEKSLNEFVKRSSIDLSKIQSSNGEEKSTLKKSN